MECRCPHIWITLSSRWCPQLGICLYHKLYTLQKSNAIRLWSITNGFIFIMLGIMCKPVYLSFHWYLIGLYYFTETCAGRVNWGQCQKLNVAKLYHNFNRSYQFVVFPLVPYLFWLLHCYVHRVRKLGAISKIKMCFVSADFGKVTTHDWSDTKHDIPPSILQSDQICNFSLLTLPTIYSPYTRLSEIIITSKASIERQVYGLSGDI